MTFANKVKTLFASKGSNNSLSIGLGASAISYCYFPDRGAPTCTKLDLINDDYALTLATLHQNSDLNGDCELILSAKYYQIVQVDKPKVPDNELHAALKWQIKDLVTIPADDMTLDYFDGPTLAGADKINVVCAQTSKLKPLVEVLHKNNLRLIKITTEEFAFVELLKSAQGANLLVAQQPNEDIVILIIQNGCLYFYRRLRGFANIGQRSEEELVMGAIDNLSIEIQKSVDFFERQLKQPPVKKIKVLLPIKTEAFIARKLTENTHIPVELANLPESYPQVRESSLVIGAMLGMKNPPVTDAIEALAAESQA
ncbi:MAG: hypothetical protein ACSHW0_01305 [Thalassotalea sp.]